MRSKPISSTLMLALLFIFISGASSTFAQDAEAEGNEEAPLTNTEEVQDAIRKMVPGQKASFPSNCICLGLTEDGHGSFEVSAHTVDASGIRIGDTMGRPRAELQCGKFSSVRSTFTDEDGNSYKTFGCRFMAKYPGFSR